MKHKLDRIEENQKQLAVSMPEKPELDPQESSLQNLESESKTIAQKKETRGLWVRIWNKLNHWVLIC